MDGKRPLISVIPVPNVVTVKEEFTVYGRDMVNVPSLLSLQLGDPQTRVCPPRECQCTETWRSGWGDHGPGAWEIHNFPGSPRCRLGLRRQS